MTSRDFCYWLQGYFELINERDRTVTQPGSLSADQAQCVQKHLAMVFVHEIDPSFGGKEEQVKLDEAHASKPSSIGGVGPNGILYRC